eukprot:7906936-Pyramimonas_sp.AAC.1
MGNRQTSIGFPNYEYSGFSDPTDQKYRAITQQKHPSVASSLHALCLVGAGLHLQTSQRSQS